jgi:hypothetical protein
VIRTATAAIVGRMVNFEQTHPSNVPRFSPPAGQSATEIMAILNIDKHKEYARYAAHCLGMVPAATEQEARVIQREMAAEWLRLAEDIRRRSRRAQMQME